MCVKSVEVPSQYSRPEGFRAPPGPLSVITLGSHSALSCPRYSLIPALPSPSCTHLSAPLDCDPLGGRDRDSLSHRIVPSSARHIVGAQEISVEATEWWLPEGEGSDGGGGTKGGHGDGRRLYFEP